MPFEKNFHLEPPCIQCASPFKIFLVHLLDVLGADVVYHSICNTLHDILLAFHYEIELTPI